MKYKKTFAPGSIGEFLQSIGAKGGKAKTDAKREAGKANIEKARLAKAEKAKAKDTATTADLSIRVI